MLSFILFVFITTDRFVRYTNINKMHNVLSCPTCVDYDNTFYFGYFSGVTEPDACENRCLAEPRCYIYTFYSASYPNKYWSGECVGASYNTGINVADNYAFSGVRNNVETGNYNSCASR